MKRIVTIGALATLATGAFAQSFFEGFESLQFSATPPTRTGTVTGAVVWNFNNNSGGTPTTNWFQGNDAVFPAQAGSTTSYIGANFNNASGANTIDNWLMSPVRTFNNGDTISFWTRTVSSPAFPDRLIVKLRTGGAANDINAFTTTLLTINPNLTTSGYPNAWTQYTINISGLGGPTSGQFAFNYNVPNGGPSGANSDYIGIDSVQYTAVPEPATMAALGLGAAALLRRRRK